MWRLMSDVDINKNLEDRRSEEDFQSAKAWFTSILIECEIPHVGNNT